MNHNYTAGLSCSPHDPAVTDVLCFCVKSEQKDQMIRMDNGAINSAE